MSGEWEDKMLMAFASFAIALGAVFFAGLALVGLWMIVTTPAAWLPALVIIPAVGLTARFVYRACSKDGI